MYILYILVFNLALSLRIHFATLIPLPCVHGGGGGGVVGGAELSNFLLVVSAVVKSTHMVGLKVWSR
jgi:hypothetical protein